LKERQELIDVLTMRHVAEENAQEYVDSYAIAVLQKAVRRVEDPAERKESGSGLGWESARDVLHRMMEEIERGKRL
jgi:hypothetical protein